MATKPEVRTIGTKAVAPPPTRKRRAAVFQAYVVAASGLFIALAIAAHFVPYFRFDLAVTRFIQRDHGAIFDALMHGWSWAGFPPQAFLIVATVVVLLFVAGLRWEAVAVAFAGSGAIVGTITKMIVLRPRPSADLVHVVRELTSSSFPSGHVLLATTFGGFLGFLAYTLLRESWARTLALAAAVLIVGLMGPSRVYLGQHWFSDTMGAYVLGSVWLALSIRLYRWGKTRFFVEQKVAPPAATEVKAHQLKEGRKR